MQIRSVTIEGFKSFRNVVEIANLDPGLNAVTGISKSGKSNIVDAIFFVWDAADVQEPEKLIYDSGRSGITRATVKITFDNNDKNQSPAAYLNYDRIKIAKFVELQGNIGYQINEIAVTNKAAIEFLCTMQLNSQSLDLVQRNYKSILLRSPLEIFEMVQEASGTKTLKTLQHELERTLNDNKPDELEVTLRDIGLHIKQQKEERTRAYQRSQKEFDKARYDEILRKYKQAEEKSNMVRDQIIATISRNKNNEGTDMEKLLDKSSGLVPSDTLHIQLIEAYRGHTDALARVTLSTLDRKVAAKRLLVLRNECAPFIELFHREQEALLQQQGLCAEIEKELSSISGSNERKSELEKEVASLQDKINKKVEEMEKLATPKLNRCSFNYTPPEPDFDSKRVLGTIARLIDANPDCYLGLEDIAGDRLFDVVVDTDETRELLLQHGNVDPDITIVSVEEASESYLVPWIVTAAQEIGGVDNVGRASDFIKAEEPLRRVMSRIFGCTLLCREMILAITVCQSPRVNMPCITFEGDMWDPVGVMSGGAVEGGSVLLKLQILKQHEAELQMLKQELVAAQETLSKMKELLPKYQMMCKELESARSHLTELKMKLPDMEFLEAQVAEKTAIVERDKEAQHAATAKIVELEAMVKGNIGHTREFQTVEKASSEARLNARVHGDAWCNVLFEQESHRLESKVLQQTVESGQKKLAEAGATSAQLKPAPKKATANRKTAVESHRLESKVLQQTVESGQKKLAEAGAASAQLKPAPKKATANRKTAVEQRVEVKEPWITTDKFGASGSVYDYSAHSADLAPSRLQDLVRRRESQLAGLEPCTTTVQTDEEYAQLLQYKVNMDVERSKLMQFMKTCDVMQKQALSETYDKVKSIFAIIFNTILPDSYARLMPFESHNITSGIEIQLSVDLEWDVTVDDLSIQERAVVAVSLTLALLISKKAPINILDVIDTGLDPIHVQRLARILQDYFRNSQLLIVSREKSILNKCGVHFKTNKIRGQTTIKRSTHSDDEDDEDVAMELALMQEELLQEALMQEEHMQEEPMEEEPMED